MTPPQPTPPAPARPARLRRLGVVALAMGIGGVVRLLVPPASPPPSAQPAPLEAPAPAAPTPGPTAAGETRVYLGPGSPLAPELNAPEGGGARDVEILHQLTGALLSSLKGPARPPLGSNLDFARALRGENKLRVVLLPGRHPAFGPQGHLVDRWGTPYHFHPLSSNWVEIRSAGPDCTLFTDDDFVDKNSGKKKHLPGE